MRKIVLISSLLLYINCIYGQVNINKLKNITKENFELSDFWNVEPILYNQNYNEKNRVYRWQNYWYMRELNTKELIPETLKVKFFFSANDLHLEDLEAFVTDKDYIFRSEIQYKYGDTDYSYNIRNPKLSKPIKIVEKIISLGSITKNAISGEGVSMFDFIIDVPIKKQLTDLDIYICDTTTPTDDFFALNQIIITSYFIDKNGNKKNTFEFTLPINGSYKEMPEYGKINQ